MNIAKSSILISVLSFFSTLLGFFIQLILANYYGASVEIDLYIIANSIPFLVTGVVVSAFSFSLTPYLISQKVLDGYPNFLGLLFQYVLLFSIIVLAFGILTSSNVVDFYGENYLRKDLDDAVVIARIAWITAILSILIGLFTSIYNANEKYIMPIFFSLIPVLSSIFFGVLGREEYGIV